MVEISASELCIGKYSDQVSVWKCVIVPSLKIVLLYSILCSFSHLLWLWLLQFLCWGSDGQNGKLPAQWPTSYNRKQTGKGEQQHRHKLIYLNEQQNGGRKQWLMKLFISVPNYINPHPNSTWRPVSAQPVPSAGCEQSASGNTGIWTMSACGTPLPPPPQMLMSCSHAAPWEVDKVKKNTTHRQSEEQNQAFSLWHPTSTFSIFSSSRTVIAYGMI